MYPSKNLDVEVMKNKKRIGEDFGGSSKKQKLTEHTDKLTADSSHLKTRRRFSDFRKIDLNTHLQIDFGLLQSGDVLGDLKRDGLKMVTVGNCPSLNDIVTAMTKTDFAKALNESDVFVLHISATESTSANDESKTVQKISEVVDKPMILQFTIGDKRSIFYQESSEGFKKLNLRADTGIVEATISNCIDFETMCNFLHLKSDFGKFNFNLIEVEVAMEKSICGLRLTDWAVKHNNILCLMFLQLFNPDLESFNDNSTRVLEVAAGIGTLKCFEILLNFRKTETIEPSLRKALYLNSVHDESLLMIAARNRNVEIVKFLVGMDLNLNQKSKSGETASDIVWMNDAFDILMIFLCKDGPFPKDFSENEVAPKFQAIRFKKLIVERQSLHESIKNYQIEEVKSFVEGINTKIAYDQNNQCALTTALLSKNFEAYSFLRSRGFSGGIDFKLEKSLADLSYNDKKQLMKSNLKYFPANINQHILGLVSKSRQAFGDKQNNFDMIKKWFEKLDAIPEVRPILKIVASSEKVDIVFDFNKNSIEEMDPTGSGEVYGRTYHKSGNIFIGAKQNSGEHEILGILAQELAHYALQLVYSNNCLPFYMDDESRKKEYEAIVETFDNKGYKSKNEIIARALHENHSEEIKMRKLIVRVPHLLALHSDEIEVLSEIRKDFGLLFDFFEHKTLPDLQIEEELIGPKQIIREANTYFGVYAKVLQSTWLSPDFERTIDVHRKVFLESSVPELVLESLVQQMKDNDSSSNNIFVNIDQLLNTDNQKILRNAAESEVRPSLIIIEHSNDVSSKTVGNELQYFFREFKVVLISSIKNSGFRNYFESKIEVDFHWNDLNERSKSRILETTVIFQDSEVTLNEILDDESLLQLAPLEMILKPSKLRLQSFSGSLPSPPRAFIERRFQTCEANDATIYNSKNICNFLKNRKTVIIADLAGMGKSAAAAQFAREVKRQNPSSWVVFIELKQHTEAFSRDNLPQRIEASFYSQKVLKFENAIEQKLFESFYEYRKVIFIIDGFDEICPNYKTFVIKLLKAVQHSGNQLLLTTRPHLLKELENELESAAPVKLMPFSWKDQIEFLTQFWQQKSRETESKAEVLLKKLGKTWNFGFLSTPVHISMLAEVSEDQDLINRDYTELDIFSVYERFIIKKLCIWNEKGPIAEADNTIIHLRSSNLLQIHQNLAFEQFFDADELAEMNLPEIPEDFSDEMIARVGIITFGTDESKQFAHRAYAEYFIADFIMNGIFRKNPQKLIMKLFVKSLVKKELGVVRKLMNDRLAYSENKLKIEVLSKHFKEIVLENGKDEQLSLFCLVKEQQTRLIAFVLKTLNFDSDVKLELVRKVFLEAMSHFGSFVTIWKCVDSFVAESDLKNVYKNLFSLEDSRKRPILMSAIETKKPQLVRFILEQAKVLLTDEEFVPFVYDKKYWETKEAFKKNATESIDSFKMIYEAAREKLSDENLVKLVAEKMFLHRFVQNIGKDEFTKMWRLIEEYVSPTIRRMLVLQNGRKRCMLEGSLRNEDKSVTDAVFDVTESAVRISGQDVMDYLRERLLLQNFVLTTIVWSKELFEKFSLKVGDKEFKELLLSKISMGRNVFHCLIDSKNPNEAAEVWNLIVGRLNPQEVENLLLDRVTKPHRSLFHYAASANHHILVEILRWCQKHSGKYREQIIFERDRTGRSLLYVLALECDDNMITGCFNFFKENLPREELKILLLDANEANEIPLQATLRNKKPNVAKVVWEAYREVIDINQLKTLVSSEKFFKPEFNTKAVENMQKMFHDFSNDSGTLVVD